MIESSICAGVYLMWGVIHYQAEGYIWQAYFIRQVEGYVGLLFMPGLLYLAGGRIFHTRPTLLRRWRQRGYVLLIVALLNMVEDEVYSFLIRNVSKLWARSLQMEEYVKLGPSSKAEEGYIFLMFSTKCWTYMSS